MMLIKTNRDLLLKPLSAVTGIVEKRHTLPILSNILIQRKEKVLHFLATDMEIQISTDVEIPEQQNIEIDFSITVSAKKLQDILKSISDNAKLEIENRDGKLLITAGKSKFNLQTLPAEDFPRIEIIEVETRKFFLQQRQLKNLLSLVQYSMATQDIRYYLNGLQLILEPGRIKLIATDGHRLSYISFDIEHNCEPIQIILPRKTVIELQKLLNDSDDLITFEFNSKQVIINFSNIVLISKLIEGVFPDYNRVLPKNNTKVIKMKRSLFLSAMQRASILSNEKFHGVRLLLSEGILNIICINSEQEEANVELEVEYFGPTLDVGFNITYLLEVLNNLDCEDIVCSFGDSNSSAMITISGNDNFIYVVMPMRI